MMMILFFLILSFNTIFINNKLKIMFLQNFLFILLSLLFLFNQPLFFSTKTYWMMYIDYYSFFLLMLTIWIFSLMTMAFITPMYINFYTINLIILLICLLLSFLSMNLFLFYIFFEMSIIPTFILIIGWGYQFERMEASIYMFIYTSFASLPLMMIIIKMFFKIYSINMFIISNMNIIINMYMYMYMLLAFLIKLPMFFLHLWLPKAHVEAPISGSMTLAAIMLKLGGYGIFRSLMFMEKISIKFNFILISISIMGALISSIICIQQIDMKMLVAYSSIVHMGIMLPSMLTLSYLSMMGSLIIMIAHGLCSSGLFCLVNITYERSKSRSLLLNKGMMNLIPSMTLFWFILNIFNMSAPPSLNLFSEIFLINSILTWSFSLIFMMMSLSFTSILYSMYFYSSTQHGKLNKNLNLTLTINKREFMLLLLHSIPIMFLILIF